MKSFVVQMEDAFPKKNNVMEEMTASIIQMKILLVAEVIGR